MTKSDSEERYQVLTRELHILEDREETSKQFRNHYRLKFDQFRASQKDLERKQEYLILADAVESSQVSRRDLENHQELQRLLEQSVNESQATLEEMWLNFKQQVEEQREVLLRERSRIEWD